MNLRRWLRPGMGVKRWLLLVFVGELGLALAGALALRQLYRDVEVSGPAQSVVSIVTLQFLGYDVRAALLAIAGLALFVVGSIRLVRNLMEPFRPGGDAPTPLVEVIYQKRFLARGPRIVAIGGGTGLSALLRGLKEVTSNLTAVVTVADDGGSSGLLRTSLGIPPVGDIRNCIVALADAEPLMADLLQYRFPAGSLAPATEDATSPDPRGHAVGNLLLAALTAVEDGDFEEGVRRMNRVLAVRGQVVPVTAVPLTLHALVGGSEVIGQSRIARTAGIERVWVTPDDAAACEDALRAIADADAIVIGPGSLYTSILPGLLVPAIRDAVLASAALRIYVCNVATQVGETSGRDLADHVEALAAHTAPGLADVVLGNNQFGARIPLEWRAESVRLRWPPRVTPIPKLVLDDVVDPDNAYHHDPGRLAASIARIVEREGSRRRPRVARSA
ncbi:MAG TPA: gluconeogenesis factor YvcK family protein [Candidatus Limnocylindrales bacterium]|nr:gluconeogenesis factor YvcK family protein [Candidatus Limnocylindrales bacterium]